MANDYKDRAGMPRRGGQNATSASHAPAKRNRRKAASPRKSAKSRSKSKASFKLPNIELPNIKLPELQQGSLVFVVIGLVVVLFIYFLTSLSSGGDDKKRPLTQSKSLPTSIVKPIKQLDFAKPIKRIRNTSLPEKAVIAIPQENKRVIPVSTPIAVKAKVVKRKESEPKPKEEIKYRFYSALPDAQFILPDHEIQTRKRQERVGHEKKNVEYVIQVGAFRNKKDAESVRVKLTLLNFKARLKEIKVKTVTWYRVQIGPYKKMHSISILLSKLKAKGFDAIVSEIKATK